MSFREFGVIEPIVNALREKGYNDPTAIQEQAIPQILAGKDVLASAQTGTGKTAAFCIPLLQRLALRRAPHAVRGLILAPTRELVLQVSENLRAYGKNLQLKSVTVYGGVSQTIQTKELRNGVDIIVATPGRLLDLIQQKIVSLSAIEILVLDEADRMLDMGFIRDIKRLLAMMPAKRQNIFLSATMPSEIRQLIATFMKNHVTVSVASSKNGPEIDQGVYYVERTSKRALLKHIISENDAQNVLVFTRTKHGADRVARDLNRSGISAEAIHGDKSQNARVRALSNFRRNVTRVLVATDIAARGIDIIDLPMVINFEIPDSAETYTHRIGRTGRAGASGIALSLCDNDEQPQLKNINRALLKKMKVVEHPFC